jgi:hypothetical protein
MRVGQERRRASLLCGVALAAAAAGCGSGDEPAEPASPSQPRTAAHSELRPNPKLRPASCPPSLAKCRVASGRIVYVERVDPDGDGDAHFVLASGEDVTTTGISVIDVERELRPHPLPGIGDEISAAGPVYRGSYGQRQIEAVELNLAR